MVNILSKIKRAFTVFHPTKKDFDNCGVNSVIEFPIYISCPKSVVLESNVRLRQGTKILISEFSKFVVKKYTVIGMNNMIIPNKHVSTVGVPQFLLGSSGVNDQHNEIVVNEDVWTGSNVTLMGNVSLGRGCICGASSLVTKSVPPYAVVAGIPARIIAVKFTIEQIIEHEKILYSEKERFSRKYLEQLFATYYRDKNVFGKSVEFTDEQIQLLLKSAKYQDFTDMDYFERLKPLCK